MKAFILSSLSIILIAVLILGNLHWGKNQSHASNASNTTTPSSEEVSTELETQSTSDNENEKVLEASAASDTDSKSNSSLDSYLGFASSWPKDARELLEKKLADKETFQIVLLGSKSIGDKNTGLTPNIKDKLTSAFGTHVTIDSVVYATTTDNYVYNNEVKKLIKKNPDMVIFEPFTLNDNNKVALHQSTKNIATIIEDAKKELPDTTFVLQPPNPIYGAELYPKQVNVLKKYAEDNNLTYLDHWENWPDSDSKKILDYINSDDTPNAKGYEVWSNYITDFLVKE